MDDFLNNVIYVVLGFAVAIFLYLAASAANRQLKRPVLIFGGLGLAGLMPLLLPVYLGVVFFKARQARGYIFLILLVFSLGCFTLAVSGFAKNVSFSDLSSGNVRFNESDALVIHGEFIKAHESQYVVTKSIRLGGQDTASYHGYYEILPLNPVENQKVRVFVTDVNLFENRFPTENVLNKAPFIGFVPLTKNLDEEVLGEIRGLLKPNQTLLFISEHMKSRFQSNQNHALLGTVVFGILSFIFVLLAVRAFKEGGREGA